MDTTPTKHNYGRLIFAALTAPLIGATAIILFIAVTAMTEGSNLNDFFFIWLYALGFGAAIGWPAMVIAGLPLHALIHAKGLRHVLVYALGAALQVRWLR